MPNALAIFIFAMYILAFPTSTAVGANILYSQFHDMRPTTVQFPYYPYDWGWGWGYYSYDTRGKIKIRGYAQSDQVYINGAYAGTAKKRHEIKLEPGTYNIEVRRQGQELVNRDVYVLTNKSVEINIPFR